MNWEVSSINVYLSSRVSWLTNESSDEWLLFSCREMATGHGNSGASAACVVTLANDLNTEHRLLMWNKELSWFLCDYKYLAISFALTNTTASKMTAKSGTLHCIILLLHSTAYDAQFISVLKILLSLHEEIFSEQNYNVNIVCPAERGTRSENHQLSL